MQFPEHISNVEQLEGLLSHPSEAAIQSMAAMAGDMLILGAGGKMGLTLALMAKRASEAAGVDRAYYAVSRFTNPVIAESLANADIIPIQCDLLKRSSRVTLPKTANVLWMMGSKFGTSNDPTAAWATNVILPTLLAERLRPERLFVFSTGNVYPLVESQSGGSVEEDALKPHGEYAMTALGRERVVEYYSRQTETAVTIGRLNYAVELRYGVLCDVACRVYRDQPIDLSMGFVNVIWQGDANAMALASWKDATSPPYIINIAGPECLRVRELAQSFGQQFGKEPKFEGVEQPSALLSNGSKAIKRYGEPRVSIPQLVEWISDWIKRDQPLMEKPTHFQVRDGNF